jgi:hypothetical protein
MGISHTIISVRRTATRASPATPSPLEHRALPEFEQTKYEDLTPAVRRTDEI